MTRHTINPADLSLIANEVKKLEANTNAQVFYDVVSDAIVWSDEVPASPKTIWYLRPIFHYRTMTIIGEPDTLGLEYWNAGKKLFPSWPGYLPARCTAELKPLVEQLRPENTTTFYSLVKDTTQLSGIAPDMKRLTSKNDAQPFYDPISDALRWNDELPKSVSSSVYRAILPLLRYRMSVIRGLPEESLEPYWSHAQRLFGEWSGFQSDRFEPKLLDDFARLRNQFADEQKRVHCNGPAN